jgi:hypothetical protein
MKDDEGNIVLDPYKRVTVCPICKEQHTAELDGDGTPTTGKYETVPNGPSEMINVFT